jgi:hypothetical protein
LWVIIGGLLELTGIVWFLQGIDVLGGSAMSGKTLWAIVGPIVILVGLALLVIGVRSTRRSGRGSTTA